MTALEIILLLCGVACVAVSFLISDKKEDISNEDSYELNVKQKEEIKEQINKLVYDEITAVHDKTEAQLDKISNTKILELSEYAETILGEINRNHNETVFLYDMLNEKAKEVKSTVKDVNITRRQVEKIQAEVADQNSPDASLTDTAESSDKSNENKESDFPSKVTAKNRLSNIVRKNIEETKEKQEFPTSNLERAILNEEEGSENKKDKLQSRKNAEKHSEIKQDKEKGTGIARRSVRTKSSDENGSKTTRNTVTDDISEINIQFEKGTNKNDKILKLFHDGKSNKEIAKELNLGVGEVKLVLDLYNSGK